MQMSGARVISATWAAPAGTAGANAFLQVLDKTLREDNSMNDELPPSFKENFLILSKRMHIRVWLGGYYYTIQ